MARLYGNENFPLAAVEELRRLGHDVLTVQEMGKSGLALPDEEVLRFASENQRAVLTLNRRHFVRLHLHRPDHEGIVVCTFDPDFAGQALRIDSAVRAAGELREQLLRVNRPGG